MPGANPGVIPGLAAGSTADLNRIEGQGFGTCAGGSAVTGLNLRLTPMVAPQSIADNGAVATIPGALGFLFWLSYPGNDLFRICIQLTAPGLTSLTMLTRRKFLVKLLS